MDRVMCDYRLMYKEPVLTIEQLKILFDGIFNWELKYY